MDDKYILDENGEPVREPDLMTWARWFERSYQQRILSQTMTKFHWISTIFLGIDHSFGSGPPQLFETMVFTREYMVDECRGKLYRRREEVDCFHYATRAQALAGHSELVEKYTLEDVDGAT